MRKNIPTITRPDPAYAAALRQEALKFPRRGEVGEIKPSIHPTNAETCKTQNHNTEMQPSDAQEPRVSEGKTAEATADPPSVAKGSNARRTIDIRVNALARQEAALLACGVDPAHVIRAALRRSVKGWELGPVYMRPSEERLTRKINWQARTSLAVDAIRLQLLLRDHDPLDVLSKWALIRGQLEPLVWKEIDDLLIQISQSTSDCGQ